MTHIHRFRPEDYWLLAVSFFATVFMAIGLYSGSTIFRYVGLLFGASGLLFVGYIIRRSYSARRAQFHTLVCLIAACILAYIAYMLTN